MLYTKGDLAQCGFIQCKYYYKNIIRTQSFTSLNSDIYEDILNAPISYEEIDIAPKKAKLNKGSSADLIPAEIYKYSNEYLPSAFRQQSNKTLPSVCQSANLFQSHHINIS